MLLNHWQWFRERGWHEIDATTYSQMWSKHGGSVATHPQVIERLSDLAKIPVRYLGWNQHGELVAAIACWGNSLALSRDQLKKRGKRGLFDLGNAEIILPLAEQAKINLRHKARYISELNQNQIGNWQNQKEQLAHARAPEEYSKKFRYNQRRELRLLEEAGGQLKPIADFTSEELATMYCELFFKRWQFAVPSAATQTEVFKLLREFMVGSVIFLEDKPIAIQVLYRVESPNWVSIEYINGGVDPQERTFSPGSVLSFVNVQAAWDDARALNKTLRYSFGRADREYKDRWCNRSPVGMIN